ncbi:MAG: PAS domain S-box protein, partial [Deltaproteobacteria bacterium]|nr:PAS domain S-box protein [Deltaproteobacteria bacterium]
MRAYRNIFPQSIRLNLVLIVLAAVAPILVVILLSGLERRNHEINLTKLEALRMANSLADYQKNMVLTVRQLLSTLALLPEVQNHDLEDCSKIFEKLLQLNTDYANIALLNLNGDMLASGLPLVRANFSELKHVKDTIKTEAFSVGEYMVGRISAVPILAFAYPIINSSGRLTEILTMSIRLDKFNQQFDDASMPKGSIYGMIDYKGVRLAYYPPSEKSPLGKPIPPSSWSEYSTTTERGISLHTGDDGVSRYWVFHQLKLHPDASFYMVIVVAIPESLAYDKADAVTKKYLIWLAGATLLSILAALIVGKYGIVLPLDALGKLAVRLGKGDLAARISLIETKGDIGVLSKSFDELATTLEARETERDQAEEALRESENKFKNFAEQSLVGIYMVQDGVLRYLNPKFAEIFGYTIDECLDNMPFTKTVYPE